MDKLLPIIILLIAGFIVIVRLMIACDRIKDIHKWIQESNDE